VPDAAVGGYSPFGDVGAVFVDHQACAAQSYIFTKAIGKSFIAIPVIREREKIKTSVEGGSPKNCRFWYLVD